MPFEILIREAIKPDIPVLVQNNKALALETENLQLDYDTLFSGVSNALKREECHYFVAEINGEITGQIMITYEWSDWRNGILWWIQSVFVRPEYRRKGVFRMLYEHVEELARNHPEVKALRLYVIRDNNSGIDTYESLGMSDSGYIVYEKENLDKGSD